MCTPESPNERPQFCNYYRGKRDCTRACVQYVLCVYYVYVCNFKHTNISLLSQGEIIDIEGAIQELDEKAPCIVGFELTRSEAMDFKVLIESDNVIPMPSVLTALHYCFAAYYVFNIAFPLQYHLILLFLEKHVYGIEPSQKTPIIVSVLIDSLDKVLLL